MELKSYKNIYGYDVVECPFCKQVQYVRDVTKSNPDSLRDLKRHITNSAKNEAFVIMVTGDSESNLHLEYYKDHTSAVKVIKPINKRQYDNDISVSPEI